MSRRRRIEKKVQEQALKELDVLVDEVLGLTAVELEKVESSRSERKGHHLQFRLALIKAKFPDQTDYSPFQNMQNSLKKLFSSKPSHPKVTNKKIDTPSPPLQAHLKIDHDEIDRFGLTHQRHRQKGKRLQTRRRRAQDPRQLMNAHQIGKLKRSSKC